MTLRKTDATAKCPACNGVMKITMIEPLPAEPDMMQHTFVCEARAHVAKFKFKKG